MPPKPTSNLEEAVKVKGTKLYHYKGYYTLVVYDSFKDSEGVTWVVVFNEDNCSTKYAKYDGAFMKQFNGSVDPTDITYERFYSDNTMRVMSLERLEEVDEAGVSKIQLVKPKKAVEFKPKQVRI